MNRIRVYGKIIIKEKIMTCPICKNGKTLDGFTTLVFRKGKSTIIVKKVPAEVCENCNESFISENTSKNY